MLSILSHYQLTVALQEEAHSGDWACVFLQGNILLVGHATGEVVLWEFKRTGWETVKALKDAHNSPVTTAAFLESSSQLAISGDAKGRLVLHNVTAYLSITSIFAGQSVSPPFWSMHICPQLCHMLYSYV